MLRSFYAVFVPPSLRLFPQYPATWKAGPQYNGTTIPRTAYQPKSLTAVSSVGHDALAAPKIAPGACDRKGGSLSVISDSRYLESITCDSQGAHAIASAQQWFALRVKSNFERITALHLRQRGYQEFLPTYTTQSRWSDRLKIVEKPLFPGYVFCSFNPLLRLPILTTPGVLQVVGVGKEPIPVNQAEIEAVWATLRSGLLVRPWPFLEVGETVVIERGPLTGTEGIVKEFKGTYRLVVSITLLQRSIAAEIERDWIRPVYQGLSHEGVRTV